MKRKSLMVMIFILVSIVSFSRNKILLASDPYPPYVLDKGPDNYGYVTDIAIRAFEITGYKAEYVNVPFQRAIFHVEKGDYDAVLAIASNQREQFVYPKTTLGVFVNKFFVRKGYDWKYNGVSDLHKIKLGFIIGYKIGTDEFKQYIEDNKNSINWIGGEDALERNLKKLVTHRIDGLIDDEKVVRYTAKKNGFLNKIKAAGQIDADEEEIEYVSIGFHENNPKAQEYANAFDEGYKIMKESGELKEILNRYGLEEF